MEAAKKIPPLTEDEIKQVQEWHEAVKAYEVCFRAMEMEIRAKQELAQGPVGIVPRWWEHNSSPASARRGNKFDLQYPYGATIRVSRKRGKRREGLKIPGRLKSKDAEKGEQLIPIRLEFDIEHHRYWDTFVWNLNGEIFFFGSTTSDAY